MNTTTYGHGTNPNRYKAPVGRPLHCRCSQCREAHRAYTAARRKQALAEGTLTHGKSSTFDAGCRCTACRYAKSAYRVISDQRRLQATA